METVIKFLDMEIVDSGNSDGVTLVKNGASMGNFGSPQDPESWNAAKLYAVRLFMVLRPEIFAFTIVRKLTSQESGTYHEWFKFKRYCDERKIEIPEEIKCSDDMNCMITFNGKIV